ncbi:uncharacterized protein EI90DRAFT_3030701, partial [Cantharellus anzutake]|uniref:uncharacterized protein n=1 Tax=Cantharellus anzutake TaxID=1750568 RepID=UPI001905D445
MVNEWPKWNCVRYRYRYPLCLRYISLGMLGGDSPLAGSVQVQVLKLRFPLICKVQEWRSQGDFEFLPLDLPFCGGFVGDLTFAANLCMIIGLESSNAFFSWIFITLDIMIRPAGRRRLID